MGGGMNAPAPLAHQPRQLLRVLHRWRQLILAAGRRENYALPGNRTRVARMGILHDTTTPAAHSPLEMPGIEPGAFHMRSERSTTEPHPLEIL